MRRLTWDAEIVEGHARQTGIKSATLSPPEEGIVSVLGGDCEVLFQLLSVLTHAKTPDGFQGIKYIFVLHESKSAARV